QCQFGEAGHDAASFVACKAASKLDGSSSNTMLPRSASNAAMVDCRSASSRRPGSLGGLMPNHRAIVDSASVWNGSIYASGGRGKGAAKGEVWQQEPRGPQWPKGHYQI